MSTPKKTDWWYSADGKRGFCYGAVKGYTYRENQQGVGFLGSSLALYLEGAMMHLSGVEADTVFALVRGKVKT